MARKRNHKVEYQRLKERAAAQGLSVRKYKQQRAHTNRIARVRSHRLYSPDLESQMNRLGIAPKWASTYDRAINARYNYTQGTKDRQQRILDRWKDLYVDVEKSMTIDEFKEKYPAWVPGKYRAA